MENNKKEKVKYGKVVNYWVPKFQDFDTTKSNFYIPKTGKTTLVTLYKEGDFEIKVWVSSAWIRPVDGSPSGDGTILSVGISEDWSYRTPDLNPTPKSDDPAEKYISISGKLLVKLFEDKGLQKKQQENYGGFLTTQTVLAGLKDLLNLSDDQIKPFVVETNKVEPTIEKTKPVDKEAEEKAAQELALLDETDSDELSF